jgi:aldehyde dehydrogenase (NAD+)
MSYFTELALQYIDGQWCQGSGSWDVIDFDPYNDEKLASITVATAEEVDHAYRAAERHQREWAKTNPYTRRQVFERAIRIIEDNEQEISEALIAEVGGTRLKADIELHQTKEFLRETVHLALRAEGRIVPSPVDGKENRVHRVPVGVVGVVTPYHFPFLLSLKTITPALALGNAVVLKPSPETPIVGGLMLAELFESAGLPAGTFSVIPGGIEVGKQIVAHPGVHMIHFTGSSPVGREIAIACAEQFKKVSLELGGNNALVVLEDADLDQAAMIGAWSSFHYQGQTCITAGRHLVVRDIYDRYVEALAERARNITVGDPATGQVGLGPMINERQRDRGHAMLQEAIEQGARVVEGGTYDGLFYRPTVVVDVPEDSRLWQEEIFAPIAPVRAVESEEEALRETNSTPYGLVNAVLTGDSERGMRFAERIRSGMAHVNDSTCLDEAHVPFGGMGWSGYGGRSGGESNLEEFTERRWISVQRAPSQYPY